MRFFFFCASWAVALSLQAEPAMKIVRPLPGESPVINPGKGWVCYTRPEKATEAEVALTSVGYDRFEWGGLQPDSPAEFNWRPIDDFIAAWAAKGKQVAFGVMSANSHSRAKGGYVTPKWVYDSGVPANTKVVAEGADVMTGAPGVKREPADFNHPKFLQALEIFLRVFSGRYDGDRRIAFIDVRSFGNWGEDYSEEHLRLYRRYFKKTRLCQSVQEKKWTEGIARQGIAVRRDGIGGSKGGECAPAFGLAPAVFEFWGPLAYLDQRGWWQDGRLLTESVEIGKPTYVELVRDSPDYIPKYHDLILKLTNRIGFYLVLKEARIPVVLPRGAASSADLSWLNEGVAPVYDPCVPAVALIDSAGRVADLSPLSGGTPGRWMPGVERRESVSFAFTKAVPGTYRLAIGLLYDAADTTPTYRLGITTPMVGKWHVLDTVTVQ